MKIRIIIQDLIDLNLARISLNIKFIMKKLEINTTSKKIKLKIYF